MEQPQLIDNTDITDKVAKSRKGVTHFLGIEIKGVFTVRAGGETFDLMVLNDAIVKDGTNKYAFMKENLSKVTRIQRKQKKLAPTFSMFVSVSTNAGVPKYFSDKNGIFTCLIGDKWRKCQMLKDYQIQHGLKNKNNVQSKIYSGSDGLEHAILHRFSSEQTLSFVVLPNKK